MYNCKVTDQTYREIVVFFAPQSETKDGGAFANGRMVAPLSDKEQKIRLFPMRILNDQPLRSVTNDHYALAISSMNACAANERFLLFILTKPI